MAKNKQENKTFEKTSNKQEKLANATYAMEAEQSNLNQNHNVKKESLGANTKR